MSVVADARVQRRDQKHPGREPLGEGFQDERSCCPDCWVGRVGQLQGRRQVDRMHVERQRNRKGSGHDRAIVARDEWLARLHRGRVIRGQRRSSGQGLARVLARCGNLSGAGALRSVLARSGDVEPGGADFGVRRASGARAIPDAHPCRPIDSRWTSNPLHTPDSTRSLLRRSGAPRTRRESLHLLG